SFAQSNEKAQLDTNSISYKLAQAQLVAYNNRNIDAFLEPYSDSVEIYQYPNKLLSKGKETMRVEYGKMFEQTPNLHCNLVKRMVLGNTVIDEESVVFSKTAPPFKAIAIYTVQNNKIQRVTFIQ
ncbi:MAG: nuclear transport factor 2 family protein, partial [Chitinophagaceae bacterium]